MSQSAAIRAIARELADFHWSNDPEDREVVAMAERAMAAIEHDFTLIPKRVREGRRTVTLPEVDGL